MKRYETLAETIALEIRSGRLPVGARLASVRHLASQYGVAQSTVFRAYYLLEELGLICARERCGYFVAPHTSVALQPNARLRPARVWKADVDESGLWPREVVRNEAAEAARDPDFVPLGSAFPSPMLFPMQRVGKSLAQAIRSLDPWSAVQDVPPDNDPLRSQIGRRYLNMGIPQPLEEIVVTNGAMEALNLCLMAVTVPGDAVAIESPCFSGVLQAIERLRLRPVEIPVDPRTGLDLTALEAVVESRQVRACCFMTSFHNPTGTTLSIEKKKALVKLLATHNVPLIEDDVYGELHFDAQRPPPSKAFDERGLVMHCSSLSKTLCPGYRLGWVAAGRYAQSVLKLKLMTGVATSVPIQAGVARYLLQGGFDRHLRKLRGALHAQLCAMEAAIARHFPAGIEFHRPAGGYFLWLKVPGRINSESLHALALEHGISIAPGTLFWSTEKYGSYFRINFGYPWSARFERAMETLGRLLAQMIGLPESHRGTRCPGLLADCSSG
jgi:DNA-binding transcriptional MocR family regulator